MLITCRSALNTFLLILNILNEWAEWRKMLFRLHINIFFLNIDVHLFLNWIMLKSMIAFSADYDTSYKMICFWWDQINFFSADLKILNKSIELKIEYAICYFLSWLIFFENSFDFDALNVMKFWLHICWFLCVSIERTVLLFHNKVLFLLFDSFFWWKHSVLSNTSLLMRDIYSSFRSLENFWYMN